MDGNWIDSIFKAWLKRHGIKGVILKPNCNICQIRIRRQSWNDMTKIEGKIVILSK